MNNRKDETLRIVFSESFDSNEIEEITESFSKIIPVEKRRFFTESVETVAAVFIGFVLGSVAQGFFKAIGSDMYRKAKEKVIQKLKNNQNPTLKFEISYKDVKISVMCQTNDEKTLNEVFDTIDKARDIAVKELDKKETPEMTEIRLYYDKGWILDSGDNWKPPKVVKLYKYNKKTGKWKLTQDWSNR